MSAPRDIHTAKMLAAEDAAIAGIPKDIAERLAEAQRKFAADGGCPGCGSMVLAVHLVSCPEVANDLY